MKNKNEKPSASEFGLLRSYLSRKGVNQTTIKNVIGDKVSGRTRNHITQSLKKWMLSL